MTYPAAATNDLLARANAALERGDASEACEFAFRLLKAEPQHPGAHHVAGMAALELGQVQVALQHLHEAARLPPRRVDHVLEFAKALIKTRRNGEALQIANIALSLSPSDPVQLSTLGLIYSQCHAHERATFVFRRAAAFAPGNAMCRFNLAMSLAFSGDAKQKAEDEIRACLALAPTCWPAYGLRSRLRQQSREHNHIDQLLSLLEQFGQDTSAASQLHLALGKEYEDLREYGKAFIQFAAGKSGRRQNYSIGQDEATVRALIDTFADPQPQISGCLSEEPIFVVGMPRSGTTLVERILTSHPEVYGAGELDNFGVALGQLTDHFTNTLGPEFISKAGTVLPEQLGELYLSSTRPQTSLKPRFVDKFPHNFLYAGFIAHALPKAKIVCLRRNPLDTCLSNLRESFSETSPFHGYSFDLMDIGRYYILFDRLITHWMRVLPDRIIEIDYETLVSTPEQTSRRLLESCDLPWNEACLHSERNQSPSTTASALQVREPIHRGAIHRWKKYEAQLAGLRELLTEAGIDCGP